MIKMSRTTYAISALILCLVVGAVVPRLRHDNLSIPSDILPEIHLEASMAFDAPLFEFAMMPVLVADSYDGKTTNVGVYGWFGIKVATITLTDCRRGSEGNINPSFACHGGLVEYHVWPLNQP